MINMFLNVTNRTSSAIDSLHVDALNMQAIVSFTNGNTYAYGNVSTRAIINVLFNPDVQLCEHYGINYDQVNCIELI